MARKRFFELPDGRIKRVRGRFPGKDRYFGSYYSAFEGRHVSYTPDPRRAEEKRHWKAPRWYRNALEKKYRAKIRDLMVHERYDDLPNRRRRDADWNWS